jgi:hypothetical protein
MIDIAVVFVSVMEYVGETKKTVSGQVRWHGGYQNIPEGEILPFGVPSYVGVLGADGDVMVGVVEDSDAVGVVVVVVYFEGGVERRGLWTLERISTPGIVFPIVKATTDTTMHCYHDRDASVARGFTRVRKTNSEPSPRQNRTVRYRIW